MRMCRPRRYRLSPEGPDARIAELRERDLGYLYVAVYVLTKVAGRPCVQMAGHWYRSCDQVLAPFRSKSTNRLSELHLSVSVKVMTMLQIFVAVERKGARVDNPDQSRRAPAERSGGSGLLSRCQEAFGAELSCSTRPEHHTKRQKAP